MNTMFKPFSDFEDAVRSKRLLKRLTDMIFLIFLKIMCRRCMTISNLIPSFEAVVILRINTAEPPLLEHMLN
jgi:hypothetical protein